LEPTESPGGAWETELKAWLGSRSPAVPESFLPHLLGAGIGPLDPWGMAIRGEEALRRALKTPGRVRAAAYHLLVADAFLTWACEAAAREPEAGPALESLVRVVGDGLSRCGEPHVHGAVAE
jgi:hypothetical protein